MEIAQTPVAEDAVYFDVTTKELAIALVTPDGTRVTEQTARQAGFDWGKIDVRPGIGSTDAGFLGSRHFLRAGRAGRYIVEFTAPAGVQNASASARFLSNRDKYLATMSQAPGFRRFDPVQLTPGQNVLEIVLDRDEQGAIFDLVTPAGGRLSLTLPNGQTIDSSLGNRGAITWVAETRGRIDPPGALVGIGGFLLPEEGTHHVVTFQTAARGRYQVRAVGAPVRVTAALIPLASMLNAATAAITGPRQAPTGQTRIQPYALPRDAKVGDNVTATIGIVGDALSNPRFLVRMEYRQIVSRQPLQYSTPEVETVPTVFTRDSRGLFTGTIVPRRPGILRVGVQVTGARPDGRTFSEETLLTDVTVTSVVARFIALTEQAIDQDRNGTLDRWEITARLDVTVPGEFEMRLQIGGPGSARTLAGARKRLATGEQTLTASLSAEQVRRDLADGAWTIGAPQIFRPEGNTFGEFVAVPSTSVTAKRYNFSDWDRGAAYGERTIRARGIRPAASGRFRAFEVLWDITTPGTLCSWRVTLYSSDDISARQTISGVLPAGRATVSFIFDAALITSDPKRLWQLSRGLNCDRVEAPEERPLILKLDVNPSEYEVRNDPFLLVPSISLGPDGGFGDIQVIGAGMGPVAFRVRGSVPGLTLRLDDKSTPMGPGIGGGFDMDIAPSVRPSRQFLPIEATGPGGTATTELFIDVVK